MALICRERRGCACSQFDRTDQPTECQPLIGKISSTCSLFSLSSLSGVVVVFFRQAPKVQN
jgi:hypothetical protein